MSEPRGAWNRRLAFALAGVLLVGAYGVYRASRDASARVPARPSPTEREASSAVAARLASSGSEAPSSAGDSTERRAAREPAESGAAVLLVVDVEGHPITDAVAAICAPGTRALDPHDPKNLGTSDANGLVRIPSSWVREHADATIAVLHRDYATASVRSGALQDGEERVVLALGLACRVRCIDLDELPLAGVLVRVSREPFEWFASLPAELPSLAGPDETTRIHSAFSDSHGIATLSGLSPGAYSISAYLEHFIVVQGDEDDFAFEAPTDAIETVRLAPIVAFVGRFDGDEVLTWSCEMREGSSASGGVNQAMTRREKLRLEERFPGSFVLASPPTASKQPVPWRLKVLFARHPAETFEVVPVRVDEIVAPVELRPTGEAMPELPSADLSIVDASGKNVDLPGFFVDVGQPPRAFMVEVSAHQTIRLPAGEYPLKTYDPFLRACLPPSTLKVPGTTVITLERSFRKCRLEFAGADASSPRSGSLDVSVGGGSKGLLLPDVARPTELWLPVGRIEVSFGVDGGEDTVRSFEVVASAEDDVQEILLR